MKIRYAFWTGRPRNVTRQDYNRYTFLRFSTVATGGVALLSFIVAVLGLTTWTAERLATITPLSIHEAAQYNGERSERVKLEGYLIAAAPLKMPDEAALQVLSGEVKIEIEGSVDGEPIRETLFEWQEAAGSIFLTDSADRVAIGFDPAVLPMQADASARARIHRDGPARVSQPTQVEYGEQMFQLDPQIWGEARSVSTQVTRRFFPHGEAVVIVANVVSTPTGNQLVTPLGHRLQVLRGTEAEIRRTGILMRPVFGLLGVAMAIASAFLARKVAKMHQEFVHVSNQ